jgi:hypothetical protein
MFETVLSTEPRKTHVPFLHCLFVTCTEGIFFLFILDPHITYYNITCNIMIYLSKKRPLTWNGGSSYLVTNHHPCWSLAQSQLPHFKIPPCPQHPSSFSPLPNKSNTIHTHDIDMPVCFLSGTVNVVACYSTLWTTELQLQWEAGGLAWENRAGLTTYDGIYFWFF